MFRKVATVTLEFSRSLVCIRTSQKESHVNIHIKARTLLIPPCTGSSAPRTTGTTTLTHALDDTARMVHASSTPHHLLHLLGRSRELCLWVTPLEATEFACSTLWHRLRTSPSLLNKTGLVAAPRSRSSYASVKLSFATTSSRLPCLSE